jgi:hypothetical protein
LEVFGDPGSNVMIRNLNALVESGATVTIILWYSGIKVAV